MSRRRINWFEWAKNCREGRKNRGLPERAPGCDDDRLDGESWEDYCVRKCREMKVKS